MNTQKILRNFTTFGQQPVLLFIGAIIMVFMPVLLAISPFVPVHTYRLSPENVRLIAAQPGLGIRQATETEPVFDLKSAHRLGSGKVHQYTYRFSSDVYAEQDVSVFLSAAPSETRIYMNGIALQASTSKNIPAPGLEAYRFIVGIPAHFFHPGTNTLGVVLSPSDKVSSTGHFYMGPKEPLATAFARLNKHRQILPPLLTGFGVFLLFTCIFGLILSKSRKPYYWAFLLSVLFLLWGRVEIIELLWLTGSQAALLLSAAGTALFCLLCLSRVCVAKPVQWIVLAIFVLASLVIIWALRADRLDQILQWVILGLLLPVLAFLYTRMWRFYTHNRPHKKLEFCLFALAGASMIPLLLYGVPSLSPARLNLGAPWTIAYLSLLLPICLCLISTGRMIGLLKLYQTARQRLQIQLAETGRRLTEKEVALQEETKKRTKLEERQRLSRDMHDGIGGHLLSLLLRVRSGRIDMGQIESEIEDGINDLRLVVDSMDQSADNLTQALAVFRSRVSDQMAATNIKLKWIQSDQVYLQDTGVRTTLNLYRFLQEAVSNSVRHGKAKLLQISLLQEEADHTLVISVADDGIGMPDTKNTKFAGKGLKNMQVRARSLGGQMIIGTGLNGKGTSIPLEIPPMKS